MTAFVAGGLIVLAGAGVAGLYAWSSGELRSTVDDPTHPFTAPTDSASIARGEHVMKALAKCGDCHGEDYGGRTMIDDPAIGRLSGPNITTGRGGVLTGMTDADIERAIRHGVAKDGRRLVLMPSHEYQLMSDEDVGVLIAYLRSVAPVDREIPPNRVGPLARALYAAGKMPLFPANSVTHRNEVVSSVHPDSTVEYGRYLVNGGCSGCHAANLSGGPIGGAPPDWPHAANLTPTGLAAYDYDAFVRVLTTGTRPDGTTLHPVMPVQATKLMTPVEMTAIWKYLQTVPAAETGTR
ncbi:MAG: cytochrome C [Gemmatimonas sp.]|nr:cytochrome C [Gemmatimonas sp.]